MENVEFGRKTTDLQGDLAKDNKKSPNSAETLAGEGALRALAQLDRARSVSSNTLTLGGRPSENRAANFKTLDALSEILGKYRFLRDCEPRKAARDLPQVIDSGGDPLLSTLENIRNLSAKFNKGNPPKSFETSLKGGVDYLIKMKPIIPQDQFDDFALGLNRGFLDLIDELTAEASKIKADWTPRSQELKTPEEILQFLEEHPLLEKICNPRQGYETAKHAVYGEVIAEGKFSFYEDDPLRYIVDNLNFENQPEALALELKQRFLTALNAELGDMVDWAAAKIASLNEEIAKPSISADTAPPKNLAHKSLSELSYLIEDYPLINAYEPSIGSAGDKLTRDIADLVVDLTGAPRAFEPTLKGQIDHLIELDDDLDPADIALITGMLNGVIQQRILAMNLELQQLQIDEIIANPGANRSVGEINALMDKFPLLATFSAKSELGDWKGMAEDREERSSSQDRQTGFKAAGETLKTADDEIVGKRARRDSGRQYRSTVDLNHLLEKTLERIKGDIEELNAQVLKMGKAKRKSADEIARGILKFRHGDQRNTGIVGNAVQRRNVHFQLPPEAT